MDGGRIPSAPKLSAERSIEVGWLRAESGRVGARFGRSTLGRFVPTLADIYHMQMQRMHIYYTTQGKQFPALAAGLTIEPMPLSLAGFWVIQTSRHIQSTPSDAVVRCY